MVAVPGPIAGRKIGVIADSDSDIAGIRSLRKALLKQEAELLVIAPHGGFIGKGRNKEVVQRTVLTARSIEFDAWWWPAAPGTSRTSRR